MYINTHYFDIMCQLNALTDILCHLQLLSASLDGHLAVWDYSDGALLKVRDRRGEKCESPLHVPSLIMILGSRLNARNSPKRQPRWVTCLMSYTSSCLDNTRSWIWLGSLLHIHLNTFCCFDFFQDIDFGRPLYRFGIRPGRQDPSLFFVTDISKHCALWCTTLLSEILFGPLHIHLLEWNSVWTPAHTSLRVKFCLDPYTYIS